MLQDEGKGHNCAQWLETEGRPAPPTGASASGRSLITEVWIKSKSVTHPEDISLLRESPLSVDQIGCLLLHTDLSNRQTRIEAIASISHSIDHRHSPSLHSHSTHQRISHSSEMGCSERRCPADTSVAVAHCAIAEMIVSLHTLRLVQEMTVILQSLMEEVVPLV